MKEIISFGDFDKLDIRVGTVTSAEKVGGADRLLRLMVDIGEEKDWQVVSGIAEYFPDPSVLVGKQVPVLVNLAPRIIKDIESRGMILYAVGDDFLCTMEPGEKNIPPGTAVR